MIYHHIGKLEDVGMVEVVREVRTGNFIEKYYKATAEIFHFSYGTERGESYAKELVMIALQQLDQNGVRTHVNDQLVSSLVETLQDVEGIGSHPEIEKWIESLDCPYLMRCEISKYMRFILMTDKELESWVASNRELGKLLKSSLREPIDREYFLKATHAQKEDLEVEEPKRPVVQDYGL